MADVRPKSFQKIAVLGSSSGGVAIAISLIKAGWNAVIIEPDEHAAERLREVMKMGRNTRPNAPDLPQVTTSLETATHCDLVIDALQDEPELRVPVYRRLQEQLQNDTVYVVVEPSELERICPLLNDPSRLVGLSVYGPAAFRRLVEVVPLRATADDIHDAICHLLRKIGKDPIPAPVGRASIGKRLLDRFHETADALLMDGAVPHELDEAMVAFGYDIGIYEAQDLIGLDVAHAARQRQVHGRDPARRYIPIADRMVAEGRLGKKVSVGWYRYPGGGGAVIDPLVEDLVREEAWFGGVQQRHFSEAAIQHRLLLGLIHEGALMLDDATAQDAGEIDAVAVAGLGFPPLKGGPMTCADHLGLEAIRRDLSALAEEDSVVWSVPRVIDDCIAEGTALTGRCSAQSVSG